MRNRIGRTALGALLALLVLACGGGDGDDEDEAPKKYGLRHATGDALEAARIARLEGDALLAAGRENAARESYVRSFNKTREALEEQEGSEARAEVLNRLSNTSFVIARLGLPSYLGRAVEYANKALEEGSPNELAPWINKAGAYVLAGMLDEAQQVLEMVHNRLAPEDRHIVVRDLVEVYRLQAQRLIIDGELGARNLARRSLDQAWAMLPDAGENERVDQLRQQLYAAYATDANKVKDDPLELAKVHAEYGIVPQVAREKFAVAEKQRGRSLEVRWVEARYIEEMEGGRASLEKAAEHYRQLMSRQQRAVFAAAGLGRVLYALGKFDEAIGELGSYPELTSELRRVLVLLRLSRIESKGEADRALAETEFAEIEKLLARGVEEEAWARLLVRVAMTSVLVGDRDRLAWVVDRLQAKRPGDPRIPVLDAELRTLKGIAPGDD